MTTIIIAVAALAISIVAFCWAEQTRRICADLVNDLIKLEEEKIK